MVLIAKTIPETCVSLRKQNSDMKPASIIISALTAIILISACSTTAGTKRNGPAKGKDGIVRILAIGNSFSEDAVEQELYGLFNAVGQPVIIGNMYIGGCSLEKHCLMADRDSARYQYRKIVDGVKTRTDSVRLSTALNDEPWDYVSVQQGAGKHGIYESLEPDLSKLIAYCLQTASKKDFKLVYHVPWAAQKGCDSYKFAFYDNDQAKMYDMIVDATKKIVAEHEDFDLVMNVMDAIQNARTSYLGDTFCRDGWHLSKTVGRYTASCLWYEKIMGRSVVGNPYHPDTISEGEAAVCQLAAHYACIHPYQITPLQ